MKGIEMAQNHLKQLLFFLFINFSFFVSAQEVKKVRTGFETGLSYSYQLKNTDKGGIGLQAGLIRAYKLNNNYSFQSRFGLQFINFNEAWYYHAKPPGFSGYSGTRKEHYSNIKLLVQLSRTWLQKGNFSYSSVIGSGVAVSISAKANDRSGSLGSTNRFSLHWSTGLQIEWKRKNGDLIFNPLLVYQSLSRKDEIESISYQFNLVYLPNLYD